MRRTKEGEYPPRATLKKLDGEKKNIVSAISSGQGGGNALLQRLGEVETEVQHVTQWIDGVRAELTALDLEAVDERDLKRALASFVPVWCYASRYPRQLDPGFCRELKKG